MTIGSVNMMRNAIVKTKRISWNTLTFVNSAAMTLALGSSVLRFLTALAITWDGRVSGMKHIASAKAAPQMMFM
jgi:hypothetical protein